MKDTLDITILCKVVDNFGDIGVVYRLARALTDISGGSLPLARTALLTTPSSGDTPQRPAVKLRIVCDNLKSFSMLEPEIDPAKNVQEVNGWQVFQWDDEKACFDAFQKDQPHIILECFQCGRPDWLDRLLFDVKVPEVVNIIMIDYLTAEDYAETFHCLKSLTRSARVQKVNFMPGFSPKTGGLILDKPFVNALNSRNLEKMQDFEHAETVNAVFFSYPKDWTPAVNALKEFNKSVAGGKLNILLAKGAGFESFKKAYEVVSTGSTTENGSSTTGKGLFNLTELPFMPQTEWDALLTRTPLLFIRGEDSLARACLCGVPFVWHAYPQSEDYQLVKVQALIEKMRPFFNPKDFKSVEECWQIYNGKPGDLQSAITSFLLNYGTLKTGFKEFSESLLKNGDLTENLMTFIAKTIII